MSVSFLFSFWYSVVAQSSFTSLGVASSMISAISLSSQLEFLFTSCSLTVLPVVSPWCYQNVVIFFSLGACAILYLFRITKLSFIWACCLFTTTILNLELIEESLCNVGYVLVVLKQSCLPIVSYHQQIFLRFLWTVVYPKCTFLYEMKTCKGRDEYWGGISISCLVLLLLVSTFMLFQPTVIFWPYLYGRHEVGVFTRRVLLSGCISIVMDLLCNKALVSS